MRATSWLWGFIAVARMDMGNNVTAGDVQGFAEHMARMSRTLRRTEPSSGTINDDLEVERRRVEVHGRI